MFFRRIAAIGATLALAAAALPAAAQAPAATANTASDTITLFDARTLAVVGDVAVGDEPHAVVLSEDGSRAYVTNFADASVSLVDVPARSAISTVFVGLGPRGLALAPGGALLFVALETENALTILDSATLARVSTVKNVSFAPRTVGFDRTGAQAWVVSVGQTHDVTIVDVALAVSDPDHAVLEKIIVDRGPEGLAFSLDGTKAWVANAEHDDVSIISIPSHLESRVAVGDGPRRVALDPTGARLYVTNELSGTVSVVDTATDSVIGTLDGFAGPLGAAPSADGSYLFVANGVGSTVTRVRLSDPASRVDVATGLAPDGLAIAPEPEIACRLGGVNERGPGGIVDVLRVNGWAGGVDREMRLSVGDSVRVEMTPAPDGGVVVSAALYAWRRPPTRATLAAQPFDLGWTCLHTPLSGGLPQPVTLVNSFGRDDRMGRPRFGALTAPFAVDVSGGAPRAGDFTVQGFVADQFARNGRASVTNAIVLRVR